ncbi:hypothetical protein ACIO14_28730 [Nocardia fluminea]|uniref:hypothetical protein n=1 Tax=Nocardia fluminea TaxID=134984 RepID=UPI00381FD4A0
MLIFLGSPLLAYFAIMWGGGYAIGAVLGLGGVDAVRPIRDEIKSRCKPSSRNCCHRARGDFGAGA